MVGWHHRLDGREFEWTPGVGDGQGGLACCGSWGRKESDTTEWLNWTDRVGKREILCACFVIFFCFFRICSFQILLFTSPLSQNLLKVGTPSQALHSSPNYFLLCNSSLFPFFWTIIPSAYLLLCLSLFLSNPLRMGLFLSGCDLIHG